MDEILDTIGDTIGDFFANPVVQLGAPVRSPIYVVPVARRRPTGPSATCSSAPRTRSLPYLAAALIVLFTPVLFLFARRRLQDRPAAREDRRGLRAQPRRGGAPRRGRVDQACPTCAPARSTRNGSSAPRAGPGCNRVCPNCGRLVGLDWSLCAWCGKDFERARAVAATLEPLPGGLDATARIAAPRHVRRSGATRPSRPGSTALRRPGPAAGALIPPDGEPAPASRRATGSASAPTPAPADPAAPGPSRLEGRAAPALYVVGWLAITGRRRRPVRQPPDRCWRRPIRPVRRRARAPLARAGRASRLAGHRTARPGRPAVLGPVAGPRVPRLRPDRRPPARPPRRPAPAGRDRHRRSAGGGPRAVRAGRRLRPPDPPARRGHRGAHLVRDAHPAALAGGDWASWPSAQPGRCRSSSSPA